MAPLLMDAIFVSMEVTIMFGLGFATVLTLIFVPVLYALFSGLRSKNGCSACFGSRSHNRLQTRMDIN